MKKILAAALLVFSTFSVAYAAPPTCTENLGNLFGPFQRTKLCSAFVGGSSGASSLLVAPTAVSIAAGSASTPNYVFDNAKLLFPSAGVIAAATSVAISAGAANTPNYTFNSTGLSFGTGVDAFFVGLKQPAFQTPAPYITVSTTYPTPNAGDTLANRYTKIASAAPTASYVELPGAAAASAAAFIGRTYAVYSESISNPVAMVAGAGVGINVLAALTPYSCTTGKFCECTALTSSQWACNSR